MVALTTMERAAWQACADRFRPKPRRWASPLDMAAELDPPRLDADGSRLGTWRTPALDLINQALVDLADGRDNRLTVMMPPQEAKSTTASYWFPMWLLTCVNPNLRILIISYGDEIARRWGGAIRDAFEYWNGDDGEIDLGVRLRADSRAAGRWNIDGHRGSVTCTGINGKITSRSAEVIIVDDPLKNMEEAQSQRYRERAMSVYRSAIYPRMGPTAFMCWIQTCWHEEEPIQQILAAEGRKDKGGKWRVISIPAVAEHDEADPLGRQPGEGMQSARGHRDWDEIRKTVGEYVFAALYQQRAAPAQGNLFKRVWWRYWRPAPQGSYTSERLDLGGKVILLGDCWRFATADLAASEKTSADFTVFAAWARTVNGDLVLLDRVRARIGEDQHFTHVRSLVERWGLDTVFVERSQHGFTLVKEAVQAGVPIAPLDAETDKVTRALPMSAWCSNGRVWLPAGAWWLKTWIDEFAGFPNSKNDDQVDVGSYACRVAVTRPMPMGQTIAPAGQMSVNGSRRTPEPEVNFFAVDF